MPPSFADCFNRQVKMFVQKVGHHRRREEFSRSLRGRGCVKTRIDECPENDKPGWPSCFVATPSLLLEGLKSLDGNETPQVKFTGSAL